MLRHLFDIAVTAALIYLIVDAVISYRSAVGTVWQRVLAAGKQSATILWARFTIAVAALANGLIWLADLLNAPNVANAIQQFMGPKTVAAIMVTVAFVSELARRRTLNAQS
jgi:hypothetical protein